MTDCLRRDLGLVFEVTTQLEQVCHNIRVWLGIAVLGSRELAFIAPNRQLPATSSFLTFHEASIVVGGINSNTAVANDRDLNLGTAFQGAQLLQAL